eukprot:677303-Alexandrium_andersonii.AAC.1
MVVGPRPGARAGPEPEQVSSKEWAIKQARKNQISTTRRNYKAAAQAWRSDNADQEAAAQLPSGNTKWHGRASER